ncbi:efflux RND transporter periplasmic adaptor subunit [Paraburkholderia kururiensis]|uniref:efflux RND transporter periplasmic adaptor subunit n=1 Tax=Paraburkholderia kururiensis TaxID=984307 RepID=UPI0018F28502|nr:efflux RND transporter periplasmic adaptor subunit [Paraburkholderia kururiensis]
MLRRGTRTLFLALVAPLALLSACHKPADVAPAARPVVAVAVQPDGAPVMASLPGEVQSRYSTPLSFRIGGKIVERRVRLGDTVKAGQTVAQLDPADVQKNAASAAAQLEAAQHRLVYAKQQLDRDRAQAREQLIAPAQLEQTEDAYTSAAAQRDQAAQQAALARDQLRYATLHADHDGVITAEQADTGQNVAAGQAVYTLAWTGDIDVVCDVPENAVGGLAAGRAAQVTLPALPGSVFTARVREVSPAADPQSRTYRVKLTLDHAGADVRLGMTANVVFASANGMTGAEVSQVPPSSQATQAGQSTPLAPSSGPTFTLPATALFHDGNAPAVWVVRMNSPAGQAASAAKTANAANAGAAADTGTLELRRVTVARYGERTIAVTQGLASGERVVLQGVHTVAAGEQVRPVAPLHPEDFAS